MHAGAWDNLGDFGQHRSTIIMYFYCVYVGIRSKDDDDLYLGGVLNDTLSLGTYVSQYTRISSTAILQEIKKQNNQTSKITLTLDSFKCFHGEFALICSAIYSLHLKSFRHPRQYQTGD